MHGQQSEVSLVGRWWKRRFVLYYTKGVPSCLVLRKLVVVGSRQSYVPGDFDFEDATSKSRYVPCGLPYATYHRRDFEVRGRDFDFEDATSKSRYVPCGLPYTSLCVPRRVFVALVASTVPITKSPDRKRNCAAGELKRQAEREPGAPYLLLDLLPAFVCSR